MGVGSGVQYNPVAFVHRVVQRVDNTAFMIALIEFNVHAKLFGKAYYFTLYVRQAVAAVYARLSFAQKIKIGTVYY